MERDYDIIVVGAGSGGLSVSLFAARVGLRTLLIDRTEKDVGGDCLNYGCIPSKALIHVSKLLQRSREAGFFGLHPAGTPDMARVAEYVKSRQDIIREHENPQFLRKEGMDVVIGTASFHGSDAISVNDVIYRGRRIVLACGSRPAALEVPGVEKVRLYDNESIFDMTDLPQRLLVVGGGPAGIEMAQAFCRLGSAVAVVHRKENILPHDDPAVTDVLQKKLAAEGIRFILSAWIREFSSPASAVIQGSKGEVREEAFDAVFAGVGRRFALHDLKPDKAGIAVKDNRIVADEFLRTTNKRVFLCGDIAGSLKFSHAAEQHARLLLNNLFSPFRRKLDNSFMSWVTFTDPEVATFGQQEPSLKRRHAAYEKLEMDFAADDRAVVDDHRYGRLVLYLSKRSFFRKQRILGGTMVAPGAGEMVQELILANTAGLPVTAIFNKIYPYPVASRVNQMIIVRHKEKQLTKAVTKLLRMSFRLFN